MTKRSHPAEQAEVKLVGRLFSFLGLLSFAAYIVIGLLVSALFSVHVSVDLAQTDWTNIWVYLWMIFWPLLVVIKLGLFVLLIVVIIVFFAAMVAIPGEVLHARLRKRQKPTEAPRHHREYL